MEKVMIQPLFNNSMIEGFYKRVEKIIPNAHGAHCFEGPFISPGENTFPAGTVIVGKQKPESGQRSGGYWFALKVLPGGNTEQVADYAYGQGGSFKKFVKQVAFYFSQTTHLPGVNGPVSALKPSGPQAPGPQAPGPSGPQNQSSREKFNEKKKMMCHGDINNLVVELDKILNKYGFKIIQTPQELKYNPPVPMPKAPITPQNKQNKKDIQYYNPNWESGNNPPQDNSQGKNPEDWF